MFTSDMGMVDRPPRRPRRPRRRKPPYSTNPPSTGRMKPPSGDNYNVSPYKKPTGDLYSEMKNGLAKIKKPKQKLTLLPTDSYKSNKDTLSHALQPNPKGTSIEESAKRIADQFKKLGFGKKK